MRRNSPTAGVALLVLAAACRREPAATASVVIDARPAATATAPAAPAAAAPGPSSDPLTVPSLEVSGEVELPPGPRPADKLYVYASRGDCLDEKAPLLRRMPVTEEGAFLLHLVAQPDTELSLCAATDPGAGRPTRLYGQAASRLHVGTKAEQEVRDVRITLTAGPPRRFAAPPARPR